MSLTVEKEAINLTKRDTRLPPLARQFVAAYERKYGCTMEAYMYALRRYAATVGNLPSKNPDHKDKLPPELVCILRNRDRLMNKFLSRHHNRPGIAAKVASARVHE